MKDSEKRKNSLLLRAGPKGIQRAVQIILDGGVIAFPTETFYGLGADALNVQALEKIFQIKGREENKPLLLLVADRTWVPRLVRTIPPAAERLMENFWPGPLTLVFEAASGLPAVLTAGTGKIGLRISSHPVAQVLIQTVGRAITATSANLSGQPSASFSAEVRETLGRELDAILDGGKTNGGLGSTVLDVSSNPPRMIRPGAVSLASLAPFLSRVNPA